MGQEQNTAVIAGYVPLPLWRCVVAAALRWVLGKVYG
jgi:hypothetical protein